LKECHKLTAFIVGASSDIGLALAEHWASLGMDIVGTFRTRSKDLEESNKTFDHLLHCDFSDKNSIRDCLQTATDLDIKWDILVICPGTMNPIGPFDDCNIDEWEQGILINLLSPLRMVHGLLDLRKKSKAMPLVVFFAGGGVNGAPENYSCYTTSKIALIKATELLDAEFADVRFSIIGPGWVKTKIHRETLIGSTRAKSSAKETKRRLESDDFNPMEKVLEFIDTLIDLPKNIIGGRNFSVVHDQLSGANLKEALQEHSNLYKLRRLGNEKIFDDV